jgi:hypothetical protein
MAQLILQSKSYAGDIDISLKFKLSYLGKWRSAFALNLTPEGGRFEY